MHRGCQEGWNKHLLSSVLFWRGNTMQIEEGREEKKELAMLLVCLPSLLHHCAATQGTNDELNARTDQWNILNPLCDHSHLQIKIAMQSAHTNSEYGFGGASLGTEKVMLGKKRGGEDKTITGILSNKSLSLSSLLVNHCCCLQHNTEHRTFLLCLDQRLLN